MERWTEVRRRVSSGKLTKRQACRTYGLHWQTLSKMLKHVEPPGRFERRPRPRPKLDPALPIIHGWLESDKQAPKKQRHTIKRIFDRLKAEHGYTGGMTVVGEAVRAWRERGREVFVPLVQDRGEAQVDFGSAEVVVDGERVKAAYFTMSLIFSDAFFVCVFPKECTETFQEGHRRAFEYFGGAPKRISYDNSKIAVRRVVGGRGAEVTRGFLRLQSHYLFEHHFCRVRRANEKGHVEGVVGFARRNFMVPVPHAASWEALNETVIARCRQDLERRVRGEAKSKAERLTEERGSLRPLPMQRFEARRIEPARANSLSLVRFDGNDYSVPTAFAHREVLAVGGLDEVRLVCADRLVAVHRRRWSKEGVWYQPEHYLALLERKPGAFDYAKPLADWPLPECFPTLRRRMEAAWGHRGVRRFIQVLRLLERVTMAELTRAVEQTLTAGATDVEAVRIFLETGRESPAPIFPLDGRPHLASVQIPAPNLEAYSLLQRQEAAS
jgi:transposase